MSMSLLEKLQIKNQPQVQDAINIRIPMPSQKEAVNITQRITDMRNVREFNRDDFLQKVGLVDRTFISAAPVQAPVQAPKKLKKKLQNFMGQVDHLYLSIDMDGFSSAFAPGVSAPSPLGFEPKVVFKLLKWILNSKKVRACDIAELNPSYDQDEQTARLAATLIDFIVDRI